MRLRVANLLAVIASLVACAPERGRLAHLDAGQVCVEPPGLTFEARDIARIAHAGGHLACRDRQAGTAENDAALRDGLRRLVVLAAAEGAIGPDRLATLLKDEPALALSCDAAAREKVRPQSWPESVSVVTACDRVLSRVAGQASARASRPDPRP
jgi:hypothetical protein